MSEYETIIFHYIQFAKAFHWSPNDCDDMDLELFFDYLIVLNKDFKPSKTQYAYIDQVL